METGRVRGMEMSDVPLSTLNGLFSDQIVPHHLLFSQVSGVDSVTRLLSVSSSVEHAAFYHHSAIAALIWLWEWRVLSFSLLNGCFNVCINPNVINPPGNKSLKRLPPPPLYISTGEAVLCAYNCYIYIWAQIWWEKEKKPNIFKVGITFFSQLCMKNVN